jgi:hypothetical protein
MQIKILGTLLAATVISTGAFAQPSATPGTPGALGPAGNIKPPADSTAAMPPGAASGSSSTSGSAAGALSGSSVTGAQLSLDQLCQHERLSDDERVDCSRRLGTATTEAQRLDIRRTFEAKAGLRAGSATTSGSSSTSGGAPGTSTTGPTSETLPPGSSGVLDGKRPARAPERKNLPPQ